MDKQKQIEEMAKDMLDYGMGKYPTGESVFTETELREQFYHVFLTYAEHLIKKGYRKIPENAVVLTGDELRLYNEDIERDRARLKTIRKETAEKFAERLKELVAERNCNEDYDWEDVQVDGQIFVECVDETCKEITEGKV